MDVASGDSRRVPLAYHQTSRRKKCRKKTDLAACNTLESRRVRQFFKALGLSAACRDESTRSQDSRAPSLFSRSLRTAAGHAVAAPSAPEAVLDVRLRAAYKDDHGRPVNTPSVRRRRRAVAQGPHRGEGKGTERAGRLSRLVTGSGGQRTRREVEEITSDNRTITGRFWV